jgi:hypothetical protein
VGGGSQSLGAVEFAASFFSPLEVLFVPMIICPDGAVNARQMEANIESIRSGAMRFDPVLELPRQAFFTETESSFPDIETLALRQLIATSYAAVSGGVPAGHKPYHMYGFPWDKPTGGLVVMFTNTPDNTLPLIHWRPTNNGWTPVFPRHSRV